MDRGRLWRRAEPVAAGAVAVGLSLVVFAPLLGAYFRHDDFLHLYHLANFDLASNLVMLQAGHVYVVRNLVFAACWRLFGMDPRGYYALALLTHAVNVGLLFAIIRRLTGRTAIALFGAALWGTCPLQAGVLEWYSVYGHALAATVFLVILYRLSGYACRDATPGRGELWVWAALALAGTTCFGVGIAVAMVLPWVVSALLSGRVEWWRPPLIALVVVVPVTYLALINAYERVWPTGSDVESALIEYARVGGIRLPALTWELTGYGATRLLCGVWCVGSSAYARTAGTVVLALVIGAAVVAAVVERRVRGPLVACLLVTTAVYGIIAAGRAPLLLAAPQQLLVGSRYHYLALVAMTLALCLTLAVAARRCRPSLVAGGVALWLGATMVAAAIAPPGLQLGTDARRRVERFVGELQAAARIPDRTPLYVRNRPFTPLPLRGVTFPGQAAAFTLYFPDGRLDGRPVYFVEPDAAVRAFNARGAPISRLLVAPEDVPPGVAVR